MVSEISRSLEPRKWGFFDYRVQYCTNGKDIFSVMSQSSNALKFGLIYERVCLLAVRF
jgi:hypothetical protein